MSDGPGDGAWTPDSIIADLRNQQNILENENKELRAVVDKLAKALRKCMKHLRDMDDPGWGVPGYCAGLEALKFLRSTRKSRPCRRGERK